MIGTAIIETHALHATYCSAVAFAGDDILVAASDVHFASEGGLYRRRIVDGDSKLARVRGGLPEWCAGIIDTHCIATQGESVAAVDHGGNLYSSRDAGRTWHRAAAGLENPSSVLIA